MKRMLIPSVPHNLPSLSSPACVTLTGRSSSDWNRRHPLEEGVGDDDGQTNEQTTNDGHLAHVGVAGAHLPAAVGDDDDCDDVKKLCDDAGSPS